jgi:uncharacterized protein (TIGR03435 family)
MSMRVQLRYSYFVLLLLCFAAGLSMPAQDEPAYVPTMTFDVASVRETQLDPRGFAGMSFEPHAVTMKVSGAPLSMLLYLAYRIQPSEVSGLPGWAQSTMYSIQAKADSDTNAKYAKLGAVEANLERQHMLQVLLAERFNLKTHWETKEGSVMELTASKSGSKLRPAGSMPPTGEELKRFGARPVPPLDMQFIAPDSYKFVGHGCSIALLIPQLKTFDHQTTIVDKTDLTAKYDFVLQFSLPRSGADNSTISTWPGIEDAVPEQLGLKLVPAKGQIKTFVVDHIDHPSEN